jgi:hypothetical protein
MGITRAYELPTSRENAFLLSYTDHDQNWSTETFLSSAATHWFWTIDLGQKIK